MISYSFGRIALVLSGTVAAAILVVGCASMGSDFGGKPEDVVKNRAQARVELLNKKNFEEAYNYLTPSYRAVHDRAAYRARFGDGIKWVDPKVSRVDCQEDRCKVMISLAIVVAAPAFKGMPIPSSMEEVWLKEDGKWWFYQAD